MSEETELDRRAERVADRIIRVVSLLVRSAIGAGLFLVFAILTHRHGTDRWLLVGLGVVLPFANDLNDHLQRGVTNRLTLRAWRRGRARGALRGEALGRGWFHGSARVSSGRIEFVPWWGSRRRERVVLRVTGVDASDPAHRGPGEGPWKLAKNAFVVTLFTDRGRVRWALHPVVAEQVLRVLGSSEDDSCG